MDIGHFIDSLWSIEKSLDETLCHPFSIDEESRNA